ncbi:hypothetical protein NDU88_008350 [Pleurodeles waltl]|uniref:Otopetrin-2 n=1 Tax=Pleurodeles waltl TaxID=8319 RepID=A0AAV7PP95_PLEWA|nr:hypothetical protein NDU88_008350 [Pleurodeles waltl]
MMVKDSQKESDMEVEMSETLSPDQKVVSDPQRDHSNTPSHFGIWKKGGRLFSALVAMNILLLGCSLITSGSLKEVPIHESEVLVYLSVLMSLSILWMCFQMFFTNKHHDSVLFKDCHAGPIWLRGGLLFFGICSILLDGLKIGYYVGYITCVSSLLIIYPVIQLVFVIVQTQFLWMSSKHCVQIHQNLTRCGLMLVLATNLAVWMTTVTDESSHLTRELLEHLKHNYTDDENFTLESSIEDETEQKTDCECNSVCHLLKEAYYYLYPFSLEFSLFACAMTYVMWKNVGRLMDDNIESPHHLKLSSYRQIPFAGLACGVVILFLGLVLFVVYELQLKDKHRRAQVLLTFYTFHVICLSLMSIGALAGSIIYKYDKRQMDNQKNPSRTLDVALLLLATIGQYCISYYSIVAMVASDPRDPLKTLTLIYSLLMIIQHSLQNVFITEGLHRQLPEDWPRQHMASLHPPKNESHGLTTGSHHCPVNVPGTRKLSRSARLSKRLSVVSIKAALSTPISTHRKRRRLLREICVFMLMGNILLWILPAFGARLRFDNHLEVKFYGLPTWVLITNICLPFGIFYRMHAAACLVELLLLP